DPVRSRLVEEQVRQCVWQVTRQRDEAVVRLRVDGNGNGAERGDEAVKRAVALGLGRGDGRQEPGRAAEELTVRVRRAARLRSANGMAAYEPRVGDRVGDCALRRADVRDRRLRAARG